MPAIDPYDHSAESSESTNNKSAAVFRVDSELDSQPARDESIRADSAQSPQPRSPVDSTTRARTTGGAVPQRRSLESPWKKPRTWLLLVCAAGAVVLFAIAGIGKRRDLVQIAPIQNDVLEPAEQTFAVAPVLTEPLDKAVNRRPVQQPRNAAVPAQNDPLMAPSGPVPVLPVPDEPEQSPISFENERAVAQWVVDRHHGLVHVVTDSGKRVPINQSLPEEDFHVVGVYMRDAPDLTDADLQRLQDLQKLEMIQFENVSITGEGLQSLRGSKTINNVTLTGSQFTDVALYEVATFPRLGILNLRGTQVTDKGIKALADLPDLHYLWLVDVPLTDESLGDIALFPALDTLVIKNNGPRRMAKISNRGIRLLNSLHNLKHLDLTNTDVSDEALSTLQHVGRLEKLRLDGTAVTDAGLASLHQVTTLKCVTLCETRVTSAGTVPLRKALPNCKVAGPTENDEIPASDLVDDLPPSTPPLVTDDWPAPRLVLRSADFIFPGIVKYTLAIANWAAYPEAAFREGAGVERIFYQGEMTRPERCQTLDHFRSYSFTTSAEVAGEQITVTVKNPRTKTEHVSKPIVLKFPRTKAPTREPLKK